MLKRRLVLALIPTLLVPAILVPLTGCTTLPEARNAALDASVHAALGSDFNGVVLVRTGKNQTTAVGAYGLSNIASGKKNHAGSRFQIGSITKWITSIAVLRLVEQGKLALDAPVRTYLPELPAHSADQVTLRHLLSNTSGIPDGLMAAYKKDKAVGALVLTPLDAALRFAAAPSRFAPGTTFDYSVTNWVVMAAVVERVTGTPFMEVIGQQVFKPAGMTSSGFAQAGFDAAPEISLAYTSALPRELKMPPTGSFAAASGTAYSTAGDLALLAEAVFERKLLTPASLAELSRINVAQEDYALGGRVKLMTLGGSPRKVAYESGSTGGYKSLLLHVHGADKTVVILNNTDMAQPELAKAGEALLRTLY